MKNIIVLMGILVLSGCSNKDVEPRSSMEMDCINVGSNNGYFVSRCENKEVVCYAYRGISCQFKGAVK